MATETFDYFTCTRNKCAAKRNRNSFNIWAYLRKWTRPYLRFRRYATIYNIILHIFSFYNLFLMKWSECECEFGFFLFSCVQAILVVCGMVYHFPKQTKKKRSSAPSIVNFFFPQMSLLFSHRIASHTHPMCLLRW